MGSIIRDPSSLISMDTMKSILRSERATLNSIATTLKGNEPFELKAHRLL